MANIWSDLEPRWKQDGTILSKISVTDLQGPWLSLSLIKLGLTKFREFLETDVINKCKKQIWFPILKF